MTSSTWPEAYGFYIYGHACTYITYVDTDSMADTSGIRVGDMIVELDNQDVSEQSSQVLKYIANTTSSKKPPPLSVKSAALQLDLSLPPSAMLAATSRIDSMTLLGFTTRGTMPVFVDTIDESPSNAAYAGGLRAGDIIVEFDHQQLRSSDTFQDILRLAVNGSSKRSSQQLVLKYIPMAHEASERTTTAKTTKQSVAAAAAAATAVVDKSPFVGQKEESFDNKLIHTDSFQSKVHTLFSQHFFIKNRYVCICMCVCVCVCSSTHCFRTVGRQSDRSCCRACESSARATIWRDSPRASTLCSSRIASASSWTMSVRFSLPLNRPSSTGSSTPTPAPA